MRRITFDNRYRILQKIGSGATSTVYKARDLKSNTVIALKILSKIKTSSDVVQHFRREFKLLADLRHPNLCSVYDFGILKDGRSYFTMDYINGKDVFTATRGVTYEKMYPLIVQLCQVLEYIHSKGLIHYDIKPSNVLIAKSQEQSAKGSKKRYALCPMPIVKLMDFGLTGEQKTKDGMFIKGTFPYIAPEVIKGLTVNSRADLYSLGVLLYKICTRKSFKTGTETSFATFFQQQQECVAEPPSKLVTHIPKRLEYLITRLLSAEPAARFSRANEVIKEINKLSRKQFDLETAKTIEGYLLSSQFVGRKKEMGKLQSLYEQMQQGEGKVVLITGEAGIGKSRLLKELKTFTQMKRSRTFIGYAHKDKIGPLEPFHDIFRELISYIMTSTHLFRLKKYNLPFAVLFKIFPDLCEDHVKRDLPRLVPLDPNAEKLRTFEALSELIRFITANLGELIILLEDLHWADDMSIQFLEYLGRNLENRNILICGTCRTEELKENRLLKKVINTLKNEGHFVQIELNSLNVKDLYSFLDSILTPSSNSQRLTKYLMEKSGGNPFFAEEIMRTVLQTKHGNISEKIDVDELTQLSIPGTIEDIVLKRIKDLDSSSQRIIEFTALLVRGFEFGFMKALTGLDNTGLSRSLWELKRKNVLIEENNKYRFYHAILTDAVRKKLSSHQKKNLYSSIGKTLEKMNRRRLQTVIEDLAYYYINARDRKKGVFYGLQAAKKSSARYANEQAVIFYKGVLSLLVNKDSTLRFEILYKMAQLEVMISYYDDAIEHFQRALSLKSGTIDKKIKSYIRISNVYARKGEYNKTLHIFRKGIRLLKKVKSGRSKKLLEASINVKMCRAYQIIGDYQHADKFNFDHLKSLRDSKDKNTLRLQAGIYATLGVIESLKGEYSKIDYDKVIFYYKKAYRLYKKIGAEEEIALNLTNFGICYYLKFEFQKAYRCYQKSLEIKKKIGDQYGLSNALYNLSLIFMRKGCYLKAMDCCQKALSISKKTGNHSLTCASFLVLGECFSNLCNYKKAKEYFEKSLKISHALGWKEQKIYSINNIGMIYQSAGNYTRALRLYRKELKISKDIGHQHGIALLSLRSCSVFMEIGKFSKVKRYIEDTLKIATAIGRKDIGIKCYIHLCRAYLIRKDYITAIGYCKKGVKITKKIGLKLQSLRFSLLESEICYHEKKYLKSMKIATRAIKMARNMGTRDLLAEALLIKVKNGITLGCLSKIDVTRILNEAKTIAEEIKCPELLWKIYFEYGKFYYGDREFSKASKYYKKCVGILKDVSSKLKNKSYERSYLNRPDRQAVFTTIDKI